MSLPSDHPALNVLRSFMTEMHAWEAEMLHRHKVRDWENSTEEEFRKEDAELRRRLAQIFAQYCEIGDRAQRVHDQLHCGAAEPDYNSETEQIVSMTERGKKVIVETKMAHNFKFKLKYELLEVDGQWKIRDNRKCSFEFESRWKPWPL
jgi:hypothetical protein